MWFMVTLSLASASEFSINQANLTQESLFLSSNIISKYSQAE